ncbi:hypothetical protein LTR62_005017 [Meristemomyces frigidus]|uniref:AMP-binding enzyme C-terminal domain-containing protein n=1 Tax=Meristemomyces frigidus TaxID=1508187 RepID=A0AAN7TIZ5_9PEZI|nr:hypothetical protein LTR62_005017 [Meristemomyces frigidus]
MDICDGYGQIETVLVCGNFEGDEIRSGSMGRPSPGVPLYLVGADGKEAEVGAEGDIALKIDLTEQGSFFGVFDGCLVEDGMLDRKLRAADKSGRQSWYLTGDRATRDEDGCFWFVTQRAHAKVVKMLIQARTDSSARNDDVINSSGYRIGPFEVESTLRQHLSVVETAVVSSPDPDGGEVVKACIVLTPEASKSAGETLTKELQDFCKRNAAPYKNPLKIAFVDAAFLLKTISGKIQRKKLKETEWSGEATRSRL